LPKYADGSWYPKREPENPWYSFSTKRSFVDFAFNPKTEHDVKPHKMERISIYPENSGKELGGL